MEEEIKTNFVSTRSTYQLTLDNLFPEAITDMILEMKTEMEYADKIEKEYADKHRELMKKINRNITNLCYVRYENGYPGRVRDHKYMTKIKFKNALKKYQKHKMQGRNWYPEMPMILDEFFRIRMPIVILNSACKRIFIYDPEDQLFNHPGVFIERPVEECLFEKPTDICNIWRFVSGQRIVIY